VTNQQIIDRLLAACPSFRSTWEHLLAEEGDDAVELIYVTAGTFARHLLELHQRGQHDEFSSVAEAIEELHGDVRNREFATIGMLESVQNVWANSGVDPQQFAATCSRNPQSGGAP
jgi:hypothetical protein